MCSPHRFYFIVCKKLFGGTGTLVAEGAVGAAGAMLVKDTVEPVVAAEVKGAVVAEEAVSAIAATGAVLWSMRKS